VATDWETQIARLLAGYQEPPIDPARLEEMGRRIVLEANLESLVPRYEEPPLDPSRLEKMGADLAGLMRPRAVRARPSRFPSGTGTGAPFLWAAAAIAAGILLLLSVTQPTPASLPSRPPAPVVAAPPIPKKEPVVAPPVPESPRPAPPPERTVTVVPPALPPPPPEAPAPKPVVDVPAPPVRTPAPTVVAPTTGEAPRLERVDGLVTIAGRAAAAGQAVPPLAAVETSAKGRAVLQYIDGTTLDLAPESALQVHAPPSGAKEHTLSRGSLTARVSGQPAGKPLLVLTPHAEARVLGTQFSLSAEPAASRLDVREGKVRLTRRSDGTSVDVPAGHFAVASRGLALLTRPIPDEPKTVFFEVEELGSARGTKPADGMVRRIFLEPFDTAAGGWCVSAPAAGMDVTGDLRLAKGTWTLWVRYRDEPGNTKIGFSVLIGDQNIGQASTPGKDRNWVWKKFPIVWGGGVARITLRAAADGVKASPTMADFRQSPYAALNRWDRLCLTPDESFVPE
jgi:hypothetical protein